MAGNWSDGDVLVLVHLWGEDDVQRALDGTCRNNKVYQRLVDALAQRGIVKTLAQVHAKIKLLKKEYKRNGHNYKNGGAGRATCPYFEKLDSILATRPSGRPPRTSNGCGHTGASAYVDDDDNSLDVGEPSWLSAAVTMDDKEEDEDIAASTRYYYYHDDDDDDDVESAAMEESAEDCARPSSPGAVNENLDSRQQRPPKRMTPSVASRASSSSTSTSAVPKKPSCKRFRPDATITKLASIVSSLAKVFAKSQEDSERRFNELEEKRHRMELDARIQMRREDREHEIRLFQMMCNRFPCPSEPGQLPIQTSQSLLNSTRGHDDGDCDDTTPVVPKVELG